MLVQHHMILARCRYGRTPSMLWLRALLILLVMVMVGACQQATNPLTINRDNTGRTPDQTTIAATSVSTPIPTPPPPLTSTQFIVGALYDGPPQPGDFYHPTMSNNGKWIAYITNVSRSSPRNGIYLFDTETEERRHLAPGIDDVLAVSAMISADGQWVCFASYADNLVSGDTNGHSDIFLYDIADNEIHLISTVDGALGRGDSTDCYISGDGRWIAFASSSPELRSISLFEGGETATDRTIFVYDRDSNSLEQIPLPEGNEALAAMPSISDDGRFVVYQMQTTSPQGFGIFLYDRNAESLSRIGDGFSPQISASGCCIVYISTVNNLYIPVPDDHIMRYEVQSRETTVIGIGGDYTGEREVSIDAVGNIITFWTLEENLFGPTSTPDSVSAYNPWARLLIYDRTTNAVTPVLSESGAFIIGDTPFLSANGKWLISVGVSLEAPEREPAMIVYSRLTGEVTFYGQR
jgi:hypothetical protein